MKNDYTSAPERGIAMGPLPFCAVQLKTACSACSLRELCLPVGLDREELENLDELVYARRKVRRAESLYRNGDPFHTLFAVRTGFFKTSVATIDGQDHVTGFQMAGELLGIDGIASDAHTCNTVALEDSEVCLIPYGQIVELSRRCDALQHHFHRLMSREIVRDQAAMLMLSSMRAEERLAAFLLDLSERLTARGYSPSEFLLRMTREEIGSYLGLQLETVSRIFSKLDDEGIIQVRQKHIRIVAVDGLKKLGTRDERRVKGER